MRNRLTPDKIRLIALLLLIPISGLGVASLSVPSMKVSLAHGPIQSGHADVDCSQCHIVPDATWRQQIQANLRYAMGIRVDPVDFGYHVVTSDTCLGCHERPNERHPIYRFREARFQHSDMTIDATSCLSCHSEHQNERSFATFDFCKSCHGSLELKNDPLDVSHTSLITENRWDTCLGCHDFHGNHAFKPPTTLGSAFSVEELRDYLGSGPSPYGTNKIYEAETQ